MFGPRYHNRFKRNLTMKSETINTEDGVIVIQSDTITDKVVLGFAMNNGAHEVLYLSEEQVLNLRHKLLKACLNLRP